jgi:hypothetical protein
MALWQQVSTKKEECYLSKTDAHSWFGKRTHLVRDKGVVVRATIGPLIVFSNHWGLKCTYYNAHKHSKRSKIVSPLMLLMTQHLWETCEVLSDAEENASTAHNFNSEVAKEIATQRDTHLVKQPLVLEVDPAFQIPEKAALALEWGLSEVAALQSALR